MASGDTLLVFTPLHNEPPVSSFASLDWRNYHPVLDFEANLDNIAVFTGVIPQNYAEGDIKVHLHFAMSSATSGNVVWMVAFERIGDQIQDIDSDGFAVAKSSTIAVPGTSGHVKDGQIDVSSSNLDGIQAGETFRLKVTRDADNASDTAGGDAELVAIELQEKP